MALKAVVAKRVLDDILGKLDKPGKWKILILDGLSTRIISASCKMHDVMAKGVTLVESLEKPRQPLPHLEAVYIILPTDKSIQQIINDFEKEPLYKAAHIFFLEKCSTSLFSKLSTSKASRRIATLQEANMAFLPYESKIFTLDYPQAFGDLYEMASFGKKAMCERIADQVATVCAMLGEYPAVRYRADVGALAEIAEAVQTRLDSYKAEKRDIGSGPGKGKSQLIILDRGFDPVSPILHELTYQAMSYDLLTIKNDVYSYYSTTGTGERREREVILDENDDVWVQLRHHHIAEVSKEVYEMFQMFATQKNLKHTGDPDVSIKDLARHIKRMPQYQKELSRYSLHITLVDECLRKYRAGINNLCKVEQDLATGSDSHGEAITDPMKNMMPVLFDRQIGVPDKIRMLMLYILFKKGVSRDDFAKLMQHSEIPAAERKAILNLMYLGCTILNEERARGGKSKLDRKVRPGEKYEVSRWTPIVQDIAEFAVAGELDPKFCPFLRSRPSTISSSSSAGATASGAITTTSVRQRWNWIPPKGGASQPGTTAAAKEPVKKSGPTIIIFIVGGMTYSEIRAAYEVAQGEHSCEVILGSTHIITPKQYLSQLSELKPLVAA